MWCMGITSKCTRPTIIVHIYQKRNILNLHFFNEFQFNTIIISVYSYYIALFVFALVIFSL